MVVEVFAPVKITRVVPDDPLIKVFGVRDDCQIELIDRILEYYNAKLEKGEGRLRSASDVARGETVLVPLFGRYKRAKILDSVDDRGTIMKVQFLDIGGTSYYELHELRLINAVPELRFIVLPDSPPSEYILDSVLKVKEWPVDELQAMNAVCGLTKENIKCHVHSVSDAYSLPLIEVQFLNGRHVMTFAAFLIDRGYVSAATVDQMKVAISIKNNPSTVNQPLHISPPTFANSSNYRAQTSTSNSTSYTQVKDVDHQAIRIENNSTVNQPLHNSPPNFANSSNYIAQTSTWNSTPYAQIKVIDHQALRIENNPTVNQPLHNSPPNFANSSNYIAQTSTSNSTPYAQIKMVDHQAIRIENNPTVNQPLHNSPPNFANSSNYIAQTSTSNSTPYAQIKMIDHQALRIENNPTVNQPLHNSPPNFANSSNYIAQTSTSNSTPYAQIKMIDHQALRIENNPTVNQPLHNSPPNFANSSNYIAQTSTSNSTPYAQIKMVDHQAIRIENNPTVNQPLHNSPPNFANSSNYIAQTSTSNSTSYTQIEKVEEIPRKTPLAPTFAVGSQYEVYVTNTITGMQNFIIQAKSNVDNMLSPFMVALNSAPLEPFTGPLLRCTFCVGRYSKDNSLCRALIGTVMADRANLYFVDFGTIASVPRNEIYKIPPQFTQRPTFATRFCLSGCKDNPLLSTKEADKLFTDMVMNYGGSFYMEVTEPEVQSRQYCELYFKKDNKMVNVRDEVLSRLKPPEVAQYKRIPFKKNSQADVTVSLVSGVRFFVQWSLNEDQLTNIMNAVGNYCMTTAPLVSAININMPVCALYPGDQKWYRALVTSDVNPKGIVEVLLVDYGNKELVHVSNLRVMSDKIVSLGPIQAVECQLDLDTELSSLENVDTHFSEIVAANEYTMRVLNVLSNDVFLVDLFDKTTQQNVKDILLQRSRVIPESTNDKLIDDNLRPMKESLETLNLRDHELNTVAIKDENSTFETQGMNNDVVEESESISWDFTPPERFNWSDDPADDKMWQEYDLGTLSDKLSSERSSPSTGDVSPKSDQSTGSLRKHETLSFTELLEREIEAKKLNPGSDNWHKPKHEYDLGTLSDKLSSERSTPSTGDVSPKSDQSTGSFRKLKTLSFTDLLEGNIGARKVNPVSDNWHKPNPSRLPNGRRAQLIESNFEPGQKMEVIITFFGNPSLFYVIPIPDDNFREMIESFSAHYSRLQPVDVNSLKINDCIIARDKSEALCRARFLHARPQGATVSLVDYGISTVVGKRHIWAIKEEHCQIPVQAISCKLHDVQTANENTPWSSLEGVKELFDGGLYTMTFKECINLKGSVTWAVDLTNEENADVGSLLVEKGFAVRGKKVPES